GPRPWRRYPQGAPGAPPDARGDPVGAGAPPGAQVIEPRRRGPTCLDLPRIELPQKRPPIQRTRLASSRSRGAAAPMPHALFIDEGHRVLWRGMPLHPASPTSSRGRTAIALPSHCHFFLEQVEGRPLPRTSSRSSTEGASLDHRDPLAASPIVLSR